MKTLKKKKLQTKATPKISESNIKIKKYMIMMKITRKKIDIKIQI